MGLVNDVQYKNGNKVGRGEFELVQIEECRKEREHRIREGKMEEDEER